MYLGFHGAFCRFGRPGTRLEEKEEAQAICSKSIPFTHSHRFFSIVEALAAVAAINVISVISIFIVFSIVEALAAVEAKISALLCNFKCHLANFHANVKALIH